MTPRGLGALVSTTWFKVLLGGLVFAAIAVTLFAVFREPILWRGYEFAMKRQIAENTSSDLPDGLHVYMCGTGSPMADTERAASCLGVQAGDRTFIFDSGSGSIRTLGGMGFSMGALEAAFMTHLHSDHIDGLGELMVMAWIGEDAFRSEPLPIYGPVGTQAVVSGFNSAYQFDRTYRVAHHSAEIANPAAYGGRPIEVEVPAGPSMGEVIYDEAGVVIRAIAVNHSPIEPAFGYRIDYGGRSVSLSGDTVFHPGFNLASQGVDVMFHDGLDPEMVSQLADGVEAVGRTVTAKLLRDIIDYHASPEDAARAASEAGATELIFYHMVPPLPSRALYPIWLGDADEEFSGRITVGEDGLLISLPADSNEIIHASRL